MMAGLVYQNGRFFYHAWPEVFVGQWVGLDPTFGQAPVDVTHIALVSGDLEQQVALVNQIGRIKIMILEAKEHESHS
jgi:transglutaminase-like putative cysteine protease